MSNNIQESANNDDYKVWRETARNQLKHKISVNFRQRAVKAVQVINAALLRLIKDTASNHLFKALFPSQPIESAKTASISRLELTEDWLQRKILEIWQYVDKWSGVDVSSMHNNPSSYKEYWTISNNWWNRYKAEWIGDHLIYPLLHDELFEFVNRLTANYSVQSYDAGITNAARVEYERNASQELMWFHALERLLCSTVSFPQARNQPLILDQCYVKSSYVAQFFMYIGDEHGSPWMIYDAFDKAKGKKRNQHRAYAQQWAKTLYQAKLDAYNQVVMKRTDLDADDEKQTPNANRVPMDTEHQPASSLLQATSTNTPQAPSTDNTAMTNPPEHVQAAKYLSYRPLPYIPLPPAVPLYTPHVYAPIAPHVADNEQLAEHVQGANHDHDKESLPDTGLLGRYHSASLESLPSLPSIDDISLFDHDSMHEFPPFGFEFDDMSNHNHSPHHYI